MGTKVQFKSMYTPLRSQMEHSSSNWPWYHGDKALSGQLYDGSLLRHANGYSQYDKEMLKRTMLEHEATFRKQVCELHRLYRIQKQLMDELKGREVQKHCGTSQSNLFLFHRSSEDTEKLQLEPNIYEASGHVTPCIDNIESHLNFLQPGCEKHSQMSLQTLESSDKNGEFVDSKRTTLPRRQFDLELPAEVYIDIEDDVQAEKESKSAFKVPSSNFTICTDSANDYKINLRQSKDDGCINGNTCPKLADLNKPIKAPIWEEERLACAQKPSDRSLLFICNHTNKERSFSDESVQSITGAWIGKSPSPQMPLPFSVALQSDYVASQPISFWRQQDTAMHKLISVYSENAQSVGFGGKLASRDNGFHQNMIPDYCDRDIQGSDGLYADPKQLSEPSFMRTKRARHEYDNLEVSTSQLISNPNAHDLESSKQQNNKRISEKTLQHPTSENTRKCLVDAINVNSSASFTDALSSSEFSTPNFCGKVASLIDLEAPLSTQEEEEEEEEEEEGEAEEEEDITEIEEESKELSEEQQADSSNEAPIREAAENLVALSFDTLRWFAELASSIEIGIKEDDAQSLDLFEYMTLQLKEINETELLGQQKEKQSYEESGNAQAMPTKVRRGQLGRRQPRDFQKEILPGLASLSRHEVTEDLHSFVDFMRVSSRPWQTGSSRRCSSRKEVTCLERASRRPRSLAITVSEIHTSSLAKEQVSTPGILGWGRTTRRCRRQRVLPGNVSVSLV